MQSELKPCPFCGGEARVMERPQAGKGTGFFCAVSCFCDGYSARAHQHGIAETKELARSEAITAWNTRASDAEIERNRAEIERLTKDLRDAEENINLKAEFIDATINDCAAKDQERQELKEAHRAEIERLRKALCFIGKWVEHGAFDPQISAKEALEVIINLPGMPWNSERWDVDHKPYAAAYYARFPTALKGPSHDAG